ncbi:MAG: hypothetical protein ABI925_09625 [Verrucomicrobiota bacterium]
MKKESRLRGRQVKSERAFLEVLFPKVRAEILRLLFSTPPQQRYVRELMNMSGLALCTIQDELRKLNAVGLVTSWSNRYHRFYRANPGHPLHRELLRIVHVSAHLPATKHSALYRQRRSRSGTKRSVRRVAPMPTDRLNWHLLTSARKNSTA